MSYSAATHRKLKNDVDVQTMYHMREEGMSNKQIANALGVHPNTIYRYIGRKSEAVKHAEVQRKPPVVKPKEQEKPKLFPDKDGVLRTEDGLTMIEAAKKANTDRKKKERSEKVVQEMKAAVPELNGKSSLRIVSTRIKLAGNLCEYVIDRETDSIEVSGTVLNGMLDKASLDALIAELEDIRAAIGA